jgi:hypothetical protein
MNTRNAQDLPAQPAERWECGFRARSSAPAAAADVPGNLAMGIAGQIELAVPR